MAETRKIAAILFADIVGYSRLAGADEDRTLSRLRGLRSDLIDPAINAHDGRIVKWTGDGALIEFRSVVYAVRCAVEVQNGMAERTAGLPPQRRIDFRIGVHFGDVAEEADGDLMGDGVNVAARLEGVCEPGGVCLSEQAYWLVKGRSDITACDLGPIKLKNIADPVRAFSLQIGLPPAAKPRPAVRSKRPALKLAGVAIAAALAMVPDWRPWSTPKPDVLDAALYDKLATAPRLSIVVLPFESLASDPDQQNFADAFTDDLTAEVSQLKDSFVIGRDSASATRRGRSTRERSGADSVSDTCSKGARAGLRGRSGSAPSSSQPRPGRRFGPTGLRARPRRSAKCRRTSSLASPICSARKSLRLKARRRCANSL